MHTSATIGCHDAILGFLSSIYEPQVTNKHEWNQRYIYMCRGDIESSLLDLRAVNMTPIRVMSAAVLICFILGLLSPASSARKCVSSHLDFSLRTLYVINDMRTLIS